jgi:hypothetical protein
VVVGFPPSVLGERTTPLRLPWQVAGVEPDPDDFPWELYNVAQDFSQSNNLAKQNPKSCRTWKRSVDNWSATAGRGPWQALHMA